MTRRGRDDAGTVLLAVMVLMMLVSGLCAALTVSGSTETAIARNHQVSAQASAAAEAGLSHAVQVTIQNLRNWQANGFASGSAAISALLAGPDGLTGTGATNADNGSLEALGIPRAPARLALGTLADVTYQARVFDEDDPARGLTLGAADRTRIGENGNALTDGNTRMVVQATGYSSGNAIAAVEATIGTLVLPAIVTNQTLTISGNPTVSGTRASVHSNADLVISGSPSIAGNATATGTYTPSGHPAVSGTSGGGVGTISIPPIHAIDYRSRADFILTASGRLTQPNGTVICNASAQTSACANLGYAWVYEGTGWSISGNGIPAAGTYYVEGDASISGSPGSAASPVQLSIIAEGNITISGNPDVRPDSPELLFVTDKDLKITGGLDVPIAFEGQILVREQVFLAGNPTLSGQLLVEGAASVSNLVTANTISGNATLVYNGIAGASSFAVSAWRQVR